MTRDPLLDALTQIAREESNGVVSEAREDDGGSDALEHDAYAPLDNEFRQQLTEDLLAALGHTDCETSQPTHPQHIRDPAEFMRQSRRFMSRALLALAVTMAVAMGLFFWGGSFSVLTQHALPTLAPYTLEVVGGDVLMRGAESSRTSIPRLSAGSRLELRLMPDDNVGLAQYACVFLKTKDTLKFLPLKPDVGAHGAFRFILSVDNAQSLPREPGTYVAVVVLSAAPIDMSVLKAVVTEDDLNGLGQIHHATFMIVPQ